MKKIFVKWGLTDNYGRVCEEDACFNWFETLEDANAWIENKKDRNGGYFHLWKVDEGNEEEFNLLKKLIKKY